MSRTADLPTDPSITFAAILLTTIIQGLLMNIVLIGYMAIVWCLMAVTGIGARE